MDKYDIKAAIWWQQVPEAGPWVIETFIQTINSKLWSQLQSHYICENGTLAWY